jgi:hypothetical protein
LSSNIFSDKIEAVGACDHGCQTLQDPVLAMHGQGLPLVLIGEALDLDAAALCVLDIRKHHYRESVKVKHGVQIQALLGFRDHPVNEVLLLSELVDNRHQSRCEDRYSDFIQLLKLNNVE